MTYTIALSGPDRTRAHAELALKDAGLTPLHTEGPCQCGRPADDLGSPCAHRKGHHALMDWKRKFPGDEDSWLTVEHADVDRAVEALKRAKDWRLRVHYHTPDPVAPDPLAVQLDEMARRLAFLESQLQNPPIRGGAVESPAAFNQAKSYAAEQTRRAIFSPYARTTANNPGILSGGLLSSSDLQLSAPVSGMSVNVSTGEAIVGGTEGGSQGGYYARASSQTNLSISAANATNPRIDTVCATISDSGYTEPTGGSGDQWAPQVVTGTPTAGATLTNLSGAAALPASSLLLGYVLVPANATNIVTADISNKATAATLGVPSPFAQVSGLTFTPNTSTTYTQLGASGVTLTCTGQPLLAMAGPIQVQLTSPPNYNCLFGFSVDGGTPTGAGNVGINGSGGQNVPIAISPWAILTPSAGSHTITLQQKTDSGGAGVTFVSAIGQITVFQL